MALSNWRASKYMGTLLMTSYVIIDPRPSSLRTKATSGGAIGKPIPDPDDEDDAEDDVALGSLTPLELSDLRIIWLISLMPTVNNLFRSTEPGKFLQLVHRHLSEQTIPSWKHSQYFFKQLDFLQWQPL